MTVTVRQPDSGGSGLREVTAAGVVDAVCGGRAHHRTAQVLADELSAVSPLLVAGLRAGRGFVNRAVVRAARSGLRQFVEVGCGFPGARAVHELVGRGRAGVRVVYADVDSSVVAHMGTLSAGQPGVIAVEGDVRDVEGVLAGSRVRSILDAAQPVCLVLGGVLAHLGDSQDPVGAVARWRERLAPGSWLVLSHVTCVAEGPEAAPARAAADIFGQLTGTPLMLRSRGEVAAMLAGWDLQAPGLAPVNAWRPAPLRGQPAPMLGAIATRPAAPVEG